MRLLFCSDPLTPNQPDFAVSGLPDSLAPDVFYAQLADMAGMNKLR
jgi:hypothetical protein